jgi:hypothetical protein
MRQAMAAIPGDGRQQPEHRPPGAHQPLGGLRLDPLEEQVKPGETGIDQPRPMRVIAGRRLHPRGVHVEPALAREPGPHLDQPHGVVGAEQGFGGLRPVLQQQAKRDQQPHQHHEGAEIRLAEQVVGHESGPFPETGRPLTDAAAGLSFA